MNALSGFSGSPGDLALPDLLEDLCSDLFAPRPPFLAAQGAEGAASARE